MSVLRRTFYDKFFIPFLTWLSLEIQLLRVKSPLFHVPKEMKFIEMKLERSQIHLFSPSCLLKLPSIATTGGAGKTCFLIWSRPSETKFSRNESPLPRFFSFKVVIAGVEYDRSWNPSNFDKGGRGVNFTQFKKHHSQPSKLQYPPSWLLCSGFKFTWFTWCFTWCFPVYRKNWLLYSAICFCWWRIKQKKANPRTIQRNRIDPTTERATVASLLRTSVWFELVDTTKHSLRQYYITYCFS